MVKCSLCEKEIEEKLEGVFVAFDLQKNEAKNFCSKEHLKSWVIIKIVWMCISLLIGIIIAAGFSQDIDLSTAIFIFLPYMIRQLGHELKDIFNGGWLGEFFSFFIVLLGSLTVIYPVFKLYQEITQYINLKNKYML